MPYYQSCSSWLSCLHDKLWLSVQYLPIQYSCQLWSLVQYTFYSVTMTVWSTVQYIFYSVTMTVWPTVQYVFLFSYHVSWVSVRYVLLFSCHVIVASQSTISFTFRPLYHSYLSNFHAIYDISLLCHLWQSITLYMNTILPTIYSPLYYVWPPCHL